MSIFPIGAQVGADTKSFIASMSGAAKGLSAFTGAAGIAGVAIGAFAGAAILGAAVKVALDFQTEMVKLTTLVGISAEQVEKWSVKIREMSVALGSNATEMAKAMFAITSGGARGQEALDLLEASAKASAIGLGDMETIGRTATAALQAFGEQGLTSEKAVDVLIATVRAGNLEASALAGTFGKVFGTAAALGLGLEDLGAFIATYTRLGVDAMVATTGLNAALNLILKPQDKAREKMAELGIPVERLRELLRTDGLNAALIAMKDAIGEDIDALGEVIPNIRAMGGILGTVGVQAEAYTEIQNDINDSLGLGAEAFATFEESSESAFNVFKAEATETGIAIGELVLPPLVLLMQLLGPLVGALALAADGWERILDLGLGNADAWRIFAFEIRNALGLFDEGTDNVAVLAGALDGVSTENLIEEMTRLGDEADELARDIQAVNFVIAAEVALPTHLTDIPLVASMREELEKLVTQREQVIANLGVLNRAHQTRVAMEGEVQDAIEETITLTAEETEAAKERREEVNAIVGALQEEILMLEEGARAVLEKQLIDLETSAITRTITLGLFDRVRALNEEAEATKETEREKAAAARSEERRIETLKRQRERAAKSAREAAVRAAERAELAKLNAQMQEATRISTDFAESIGSAFEDVISGTKSVSEAFGDMVTEILKQVQRLVIQKAIVEPLVGAILGEFGPASPASLTNGATSDLVSSGGGATAVSGVAALVAPSGSQTIVQQSITFAPSLIDGRSGERFIQEQAGTITGLVADGAQKSGQLASAFRGEVG